MLSVCIKNNNGKIAPGRAPSIAESEDRLEFELTKKHTSPEQESYSVPLLWLPLDFECSLQYILTYRII